MNQNIEINSFLITVFTYLGAELRNYSQFDLAHKCFN